MTEINFTAEPNKQEIIIECVFDAPRSLVFEAYTDLHLIPKWWGPARLTTIIEKMDLKTGGIWRFVQRDESGKEYAFHGVYHEVLLPERFVYTFEFEGVAEHVAMETVTLEDLESKTKMKDIIVFQSVQDRDAMLASGMQAGFTESMERLEKVLQELKDKASPSPLS